MTQPYRTAPDVPPRKEVSTDFSLPPPEGPRKGPMMVAVVVMLTPWIVLYLLDEPPHETLNPVVWAMWTLIMAVPAWLAENWLAGLWLHTQEERRLLRLLTGAACVLGCASLMRLVDRWGTPELRARYTMVVTSYSDGKYPSIRLAPLGSTASTRRVLQRDAESLTPRPGDRVVVCEYSGILGIGTRNYSPEP